MDLNPGDRIIAKSLGKHGIGTVVGGPPIPVLAGEYVRFRCDFNKGEHIVKTESVQKLGPRSN